MNYKAPDYCDLGGIGEPMNPMFINEAVALGPTRVIDVPEAGYAQVPYTALAGGWYYADPYALSGRQFDRNYFEPGSWELSGRQFDRNYFEPGSWQLNGWRDAMDVFAAAQFLFPG